jgi:hypothetical protein
MEVAIMTDERKAEIEAKCAELDREIRHRAIAVAGAQPVVDGCRELLAEVERLEAERDELRAAMKPFADEVKSLQPWQSADGYDGPIADCPLHLFTRCWRGDAGATVGDCIKVAALLAKAGASE